MANQYSDFAAQLLKQGKKKPNGSVPGPHNEPTAGQTLPKEHPRVGKDQGAIDMHPDVLNYVHDYLQKRLKGMK